MFRSRSGLDCERYTGFKPFKLQLSLSLGCPSRGGTGCHSVKNIDCQELGSTSRLAFWDVGHVYCVSDQNRCRKEPLGRSRTKSPVWSHPSSALLDVWDVLFMERSLQKRGGGCGQCRARSHGEQTGAFWSFFFLPFPRATHFGLGIANVRKGTLWCVPQAWSMPTWSCQLDFPQSLLRLPSSLLKGGSSPGLGEPACFKLAWPCGSLVCPSWKFIQEEKITSTCSWVWELCLKGLLMHSCFGHIVHLSFPLRAVFKGSHNARSLWAYCPP